MGAPSRGKSAACISALAVLLLVASARAEDRPAKDPPTGVPITLPGGLVIVVGGPGGGPGMKPEVVILTPERYREIQERLERLQGELEARQPSRPRSCELEGKLEQRGRQVVVRLKATFKFTTVQPRSVVYLACQRAQAVEAIGDDGKPPLLTAADDGLRVQVEAAGDHTVKLELDVPVSPRGPKGAELGFEVGLPGAPITALSFHPPTNVRRYTVTTKTPKAAPALGPLVPEADVESAEADRFLLGKGGAPLGPVTHLALSWEDPQRRAEVVRSAETEVTVTVRPDELLTEARMRLRGSASEWQFTAPASADVSIGLWPAGGPGKPPTELPADRAPSVIRPEPGQTVWRVQFTEPGPPDLLVTIVSRTGRAKVGQAGATGPFAVGPFVVLDTPRQSGMIRVRAPFNVRVTGSLKGDARRETDGASSDPVYRFSYATPMTKPPSDAPVELTLAPIAGVVNARVRHELRLEESGWRLRMEIALSPNRAEVEYVDVEVPSAFHPTQAEPRELVEGLGAARDVGPDRRVYRVRLTAPKRSSFAFTLEGEYPVPPDRGATSLPLPRLLDVSVRAAELVASTPLRFDLRGAFRTWEGTRPGTWETPLEADPSDKELRVQGSANRPIAIADLTWRAGEAGVSVRTVSDVVIEPERVWVTERLAYRFRGKSPPRLHLKADRKLAAVRASRGGVEAVAGGWDLLVPGDATAETEFTLTYAVSLPPEALANGGRLDLPLLIPEQSDAIHTVRVWDRSGRHLRLTGGEAWRESAIEVVEDRPTLPSVVARARGSVATAELAVGPALVDGRAGGSVDRVLAEAWLLEEVSVCRIRFWVRSWDRATELQIPSEARALEVSVLGKQVDLHDRGTTESDGRRVRVPRPAGHVGPGVLEVRYVLPAGQVTDLRPPQLVGSDALDMSWVVSASLKRVPVMFGNVSGSWSPAGLTATLGLSRARPSADNESGQAGVGPPVEVRQAGIAPVRVYLIRRDTWVLICSIAGFAGVLALILLPAPVRRVLGLAALAGITVAVLVLPQPVAQVVFGSIPGLAALTATALVYRWAKARYRRRANWPSGFAPAGSSLIRPSSARPSAIRPREPSTLDASAVPNVS
jgi:hypothetical protein